MLMLRADLCSGIECDRTKQYPVRNNSSGRILKCSDCRECAAGFEPRVPCGEFIGIHESIGDCRPCQDGTYSPDKDTKACQTCQKKSCFKHQVVEGECVTDKNDTSYCVDKCVKGYSMNKEGTACNVDFPTKNTTTPAGNTVTAANTTTIPMTNDRANKKSWQHPGVIAAIVLVVIIVGLIVVLCCCYEKLRRTDIGDTKGDKDDIDSTAQLIDETNAGKKDESPKLGTEEQSFNQNGSPTANGPYLESFEGYAQNTIPLNMANNENMTYMSSSSSPANNGSVVLEMPRDTPLTIKMG